MNHFLAFALSFLAGSVPTAYLFAKTLKNTDIRQHGSGNVGATNASRVLGKKWGIVIFVLDFLKGFVPAVLVVRFLGAEAFASGAAAWCAGGAVLGHIFTPFLGFKGGKGVATGAGVLCGLYPLLFAFTFPVFAAVFASTRIVSIGSLASLATLPFLGLYFRMPAPAIAFFVTFFVLITWTHRDNITRLRQGNENKLR